MSKTINQCCLALSCAFVLIVSGQSNAEDSLQAEHPNSATEQSNKTLEFTQAVPALAHEMSLNTYQPTHAPELRFMGLYTSRAVHSNVSASGLLDDQLVGRLYGDNGSTTLNEGRNYLEQRVLGFFNYQPLSVNKKARLKAGFEIDFTFGDSANSAGSNTGGAINGDQVNLQTKRLLVEVDLSQNLQLVVGLQPLSDSAHNPTVSNPHDLLSGGGRLLFWGTDASGVSLFGHWGDHLARASLFYLNLNESAEDDDVLLWMGDTELRLFPEMTLGLHLWYLSDRSGAKAGGVDSAISQYTGATYLDLGPDLANTQLLWAGTDFSYNRGRKGGPFSLDLAFFINSGQMQVRPGDCRDGVDDIRCPRDANGKVTPYLDQDADLLAFLLDGQLGYRWGRGDWDLLTLGVLYATGDENPNDRILSSPVTGNSFGTPGALFAHHRSLLLFPDPRSVNRHVGVVYDPGNMGYGLQAVFASGATDLLAETLNLKLGLAYAASAAAPLDQKVRAIGAEVNAELIYRAAPFLWFGAHAGIARLGRFLESVERVPVSALPQSNQPWSLALSLTWVQL